MTPVIWYENHEHAIPPEIVALLGEAHIVPDEAYIVPFQWTTVHEGMIVHPVAAWIAIGILAREVRNEWPGTYARSFRTQKSEVYWRCFVGEMPQDLQPTELAAWLAAFEAL